MLALRPEKQKKTFDFFSKKISTDSDCLGFLEPGHLRCAFTLHEFIAFRSQRSKGQVDQVISATLSFSALRPTLSGTSLFCFKKCQHPKSKKGGKVKTTKVLNKFERTNKTSNPQRNLQNPLLFWMHLSICLCFLGLHVCCSNNRTQHVLEILFHRILLFSLCQAGLQCEMKKNNQHFTKQSLGYISAK